MLFLAATVADWQTWLVLLRLALPSFTARRVRAEVCLAAWACFHLSVSSLCTFDAFCSLQLISAGSILTASPTSLLYLTGIILNGFGLENEGFCRLPPLSAWQTITFTSGFEKMQWFIALTHSTYVPSCVCFGLLNRFKINSEAIPEVSWLSRFKDCQ